MNKTRIKIIEFIIKNWSINRLNFYPVSGLEYYPKNIGRDLDVYIPKKQDAEKALEVAEKVLINEKFKVLYPPDTWGKRIIGIKKVELDWIYIEIHTIDSLKWSFIDFTFFISNKKLENLNDFPIWLKFVRKFLIPFLSGNSIKLTENTKEFYNILEEDIIEIYLQEFIGKNKSVQLINTLKKGKKQKIDCTVQKYRFYFLINFLLTHPFFFFKNVYRFFLKQIKAVTSPCSPLVYISIQNNKNMAVFMDILSNINLPMFQHMPIVIYEVNKNSRFKKIYDIITTNIKIRKSRGRQQLIILLNLINKKKPFYIPAPNLCLSINSYESGCIIQVKHQCLKTKTYNLALDECEKVIKDQIVESFAAINE
jgi:hypothetical protein